MQSDDGLAEGRFTGTGLADQTNRIRGMVEELVDS